MPGLLPGVTARPCSSPLAIFRTPLSGRVYGHLKSAPPVSFPLKTIFPCIKNKGESFVRGIGARDRLLHVSAISTPLLIETHKNDFLHNLQSAHSPEKRGPSRPNASKGGLFDFPPYPRMTKKPEWWWRTLACLLYLMTFYDHQYWTYAHPTNNPPPFLENFDSLTFPLLSAIFTLPKVFLSTYPFMSWLLIVRQKHWPHFLRVHVMTAILIGALMQVIGIASGWFPKWFFPPNFWCAATFIYLVTVLQCILCALGGMYPDVPFVRDAAYLYADLG